MTADFANSSNPERPWAAVMQLLSALLLLIIYLISQNEGPAESRKNIISAFLLFMLLMKEVHAHIHSGTQTPLF